MQIEKSWEVSPECLITPVADLAKADQTVNSILRKNHTKVRLAEMNYGLRGIFPYAPNDPTDYESNNFGERITAMQREHTGELVENCLTDGEDRG